MTSHPIKKHFYQLPYSEQKQLDIHSITVAYCSIVCMKMDYHLFSIETIKLVYDIFFFRVCYRVREEAEEPQSSILHRDRTD